MKISIEIGPLKKLFLYNIDKLLFLLLLIFISANGLVISVGRDWTFPQLITIAMIGFFVIRRLMPGKSEPFYIEKKIFFIVSFWLLILLISNIFSPEKPYSPYPEESFFQSYDVVGYMYLFWNLLNLTMMVLVANYLKSKEKLFQGLRFLIFGSLFFSSFGLYQYLLASALGESSSIINYAYNKEYLFYDYVVRLLSFSREPLYYSVYVGPINIIVISIILGKNYESIGISKPLIFLTLFVNITALVLTKSTGGLIAFTVSLVVVFIIHFKYLLKNIKFTNILLGIIVIVIFGFIIYQLVGFDIQRKLVRYLDPQSQYGRVVSVFEAIDLIKEYPFTGIGLGHAYYIVSITQIHNAYLSLAAETGLFGLILFVLFILSLYRILVKIFNQTPYKGIVLGLGGAILAILVQWLSFYAYIIMFAWLLFGIVLSLPRSLKTPNYNIQPKLSE
ncbi:MAG: O-antigen ligase family protein [Balneolaceae bacterium]